MFYSIYAESTPNPEVMKFVSNRMLADKSLEFLNPSEAKKIPMIHKIFSLPFVESIFLSSKASDFVNGHILYVDGGITASL